MSLKKQKSSSVVLFFRVPELGKVKKRLEKTLGKEKTLKLYQALLNEALNNLLSFKSKHPETLLVGAYRGSFLPQELAKPFDLLYEQKGLSLGEDLIRVATDLLRGQSVEKTVIIGSDCPEITPSFLELAMEKLTENQVVLSPSHDGGYNLIGLRQDILPYIKEIFSEIPWGTEAVFKETTKRLSALGVKVSLLPETVDIDRIEDLEKLKRKGIKFFILLFNY
ncbi:MAG: DUF2064 domain-containing protein [Caldimicrobium sp.]|nr:DUF2064 domain-containing protein [Caldimicrobium sp.]